jgi:hypothetical protein
MFTETLNFVFAQTDADALSLQTIFETWSDSQRSVPFDLAAAAFQKSLDQRGQDTSLFIFDQCRSATHESILHDVRNVRDFGFALQSNTDMCLLLPLSVLPAKDYRLI